MCVRLVKSRDKDNDVVARCVRELVEINGGDVLKSFLSDLARDGSNNWRLSEKYGISKIRIAFLRGHWEKLYCIAHAVSDAEAEPALRLIKKAG